jgi:hypothetical protein
MTQRFDELGLIVDWLDAYRVMNIQGIVDLYDPDATIYCSCGDHDPVVGIIQIEQYWTERVRRFPLADIKEIRPVGNDVIVRYEVSKNRIVAARFGFSPRQKIGLTRCGPIGGSLV